MKTPQSMEFAGQSFTPLLSWRDMADSQHIVQFYESDDFLVNSVSEFVAEGIRAHESVLVVATGEHRDAVDLALRKASVDVSTARAAGQYASFDAAETLARFMVDGTPDLDLFAQTIGPLLIQAGRGNRRIRIYGEMVVLLWAEGHHDAVIQLENLWNSLRQSHTFSLLCCYPLKVFEADTTEAFGRICCAHAGVVPAESYAERSDPADRLRAVVALQQKAGALEVETARRRAAQEKLRQELESRERLLVSEKAARSEAEYANLMKDEFLATVSHELRTPLNAIIGWTHMLRKGTLDAATAARALETIDRNAKAQAQLIEDILDVACVISGKLRLSVDMVDLAAVINAAVDSVQPAAQSRNIRLAVTLDPSVRHISGDASRLQQIVWNLLSNAIKFTPPSGHVEVQLVGSASEVEISVSDTGQGISPEFLPYIFDRFRQADGSSTRRHGGLGLGLSIVRHLAELHGGTVRVQSPGKGMGSVFSIRLPSGASRTIAAAAADKERKSAYLLGSRVLVVDDDRDVLGLLGMLLAEHQAEVQTASSASQAMEILQWFQPTVFVLDLAMPDEDGYTLLNRIRHFMHGAPVRAVALTALGRVEDRARALAAGFSMFVPKPFDPQELVAAIAALDEK